MPVQFNSVSQSKDDGGQTLYNRRRIEPGTDMLLSALYASPLREVTGLHQREGERFRRWFTSPTADLFVWYEAGEPSSFEFCYDKPRRERSVRWSEEEGLRFYRIDDGEGSPVQNRTPIAIPDTSASREGAAQQFEMLGRRVEARLLRFVLKAVWLGEPRVPPPEDC